MRASNRVRLVVGAAGVAALLAACGGGTAGGAGPAEAEPGGTRTVEDTFLGDVTDVPVAPERVVALWRTGSELVDLGVTPVGQLDGELLAEEIGAERFAEVEDVPVVGTTDGVDVEEVIALEPDLIIGMDHGGLSIDYEELQEVAPVVILDIAEPTDVWDNYPVVADVVGRSTDFVEKDAELTAQLEDIAAEHGDVLSDLEVTSIGAEYDGSVVYVDTSKSLTHRRLDAAGFTYNPTYTDDPERYVTELSIEELASLADQDVIFYDATIDGEPTAGIAPILELESYQRLPAVQAGHAFPLVTGTIYTFQGADFQVRDLRAAAEVLAEAR